MRMAVDRDLPFVHRFEQRRLRLRRGPIDLVRQQKITEDRPGLELEGLLMRVVNRYAEHVARQHVAGELQSMEAARNRSRQRLCERGLANPRNVFDQQMPARE